MVPDVVAAWDLTCPTCQAPPDAPCVGWPKGSVHPSRIKVVAPDVSLQGHCPIGAHRSGATQPTQPVKATR